LRTVKKFQERFEEDLDYRTEEGEYVEWLEPRRSDFWVIARKFLEFHLSPQMLPRITYLISRLKTQFTNKLTKQMHFFH
jgi:hypothetical protein